MDTVLLQHMLRSNTVIHDFVDEDHENEEAYIFFAENNPHIFGDKEPAEINQNEMEIDEPEMGENGQQNDVNEANENERESDRQGIAELEMNEDEREIIARLETSSPNSYVILMKEKLLNQLVQSVLGQ